MGDGSLADLAALRLDLLGNLGDRKGAVEGIGSSVRHGHDFVQRAAMLAVTLEEFTYR